MKYEENLLFVSVHRDSQYEHKHNDKSNQI